MTEEDWKWLGLRMKDIRTQRKISLKEMAGMLHMHASTLSSIEHNRHHTTLEVIFEIVNILDVSMDYLVRGIRPLFPTGGLCFRSDEDLAQLFFSDDAPACSEEN